MTRWIGLNTSALMGIAGGGVDRVAAGCAELFRFQRSARTTGSNDVASTKFPGLGHGSYIGPAAIDTGELRTVAPRCYCILPLKIRCFEMPFMLG
jgi:hypothetical protein